jgi:exonuclease VII large subunit
VVSLDGRLRAVGPENVLRRGYSIITTADRKRVITRPEQAIPGRTLRVQSAGGEWKATALPPDEDFFDLL